jgi:hypothetical protein
MRAAVICIVSMVHRKCVVGSVRNLTFLSGNLKEIGHLGDIGTDGEVILR